MHNAQCGKQAMMKSTGTNFKNPIDCCFIFCVAAATSRHLLANTATDQNTAWHCLPTNKVQVVHFIFFFCQGGGWLIVFFFFKGMKGCLKNSMAMLAMQQGARLPIPHGIMIMHHSATTATSNEDWLFLFSFNVALKCHYKRNSTKCHNCFSSSWEGVKCNAAALQTHQHLLDVWCHNDTTTKILPPVWLFFLETNTINSRAARSSMPLDTLHCHHRNTATNAAGCSF